jgi:hypothetical protein
MGSRRWVKVCKGWFEKTGGCEMQEAYKGLFSEGRRNMKGLVSENRYMGQARGM